MVRWVEGFETEQPHQMSTDERKKKNGVFVLGSSGGWQCSGGGGPPFPFPFLSPTEGRRAGYASIIWYLKAS